MKKTIFGSVIIGFVLLWMLNLPACKVSDTVQIKSGAQLWGENCVRCHNIPSPADFSDPQWDLIGTHMRTRANLTAAETDKIVNFLKSAN